MDGNKKKRRDPDITNKEIDKIYTYAKNAGTVGGKLLGAGGGGHMLLLCEYGKNRKVEEKTRKLGCEILPFSFEHRGVQTWKINKSTSSVEI